GEEQRDLAPRIRTAFQKPPGENSEQADRDGRQRAEQTLVDVVGRHFLPRQESEIEVVREIAMLLVKAAYPSRNSRGDGGGIMRADALRDFLDVVLSRHLARRGLPQLKVWEWHEREQRPVAREQRRRDGRDHFPPPLRVRTPHVDERSTE